ncbi:DUF1761 domain-containing protein [Flavobacteriaceae bacterium XHP0103]|uniref:DUF1761 domain-containing protein n=1 Tax=Marixanthotalea marina TaxID=2844359 RepID=UPI002989DCA6|nr:DUF1761 domain-containing protein [Marixanthotalea marina]MBU3820616.1 DUF1761 domain-containing protein [Marixanthotalea marina]
MDFINPIAIVVAAVSAMVVGFVWYNPKVFGTAWMAAAGMTDEQIKGGNMLKIFGLALLFAFMLASTMSSIVVHQMGVYSLAQGDLGMLPSYDAFLDDYGDAFRTFKHGVFHGVLAGIFIALPILGTNALFERKSAKYIFINVGYWIVTLGIMGGIICGWK